MNRYYHCHNGRLLSPGGRKAHLHGVNLGGWLMPEGYILQAPNRGVRFFEKAFAGAYGQKELDRFYQRFRDTFIQRADIRRIADMGLNCLRVPFHYKLLEKRAGVMDPRGFVYLDRVVEWADENGMGVILDLHGAPGAQSTDWHADSDGRALFFTDDAYPERACRIWSAVAERYAENTAVIGYDLLNEAVTDNVAGLNRYYHAAIKAIRRYDSNHVIFCEGNRWATDMGCLETFEDGNLILSVHYYEPFQMTFQMIPNLTYPVKDGKQTVWGKTQTRAVIQRHADLAAERGHPVLVGEFGVNSRDGKFGESQWLRDTLDVFGRFHFHWTYWTYKAVKGYTFPDGLISYYPNDPWVARHDSVRGWDTYIHLWKTHQEDIVRSWDSQYYRENTCVTEVLKDVCGAYNKR